MICNGIKLKKSINWRKNRSGVLRVVAEKVVGIDLGTTKSAVAAMERGEAYD